MQLLLQLTGMIDGCFVGDKRINTSEEATVAI